MYARFSENAAALWARAVPLPLILSVSGFIQYPLAAADADKMFEAALEAGANDVVSDEENHEIETVPDDLSTVTEALEKQFGTPSASRLDWKAMVKTPINDLETAQSFLNFVRCVRG